MSLGAALRAYKAKGMGRIDRIVAETVDEFGGRLVKEWTPYGDPTLWKAPPPIDYRPGNLQSSWFLSVGGPSKEKTDRTDILAINGLDRLPEHAAGKKIYLSNSADHAGSIEAGHSSQAPTGVMWSAMEFSPIAEAIARKVSA